MRFIPLFALFLVSSCISLQKTKKDTPNPSRSLDKKMEPYDHFSQQRSWPDTVFDVKNYHIALENLKNEENTLSRNPCMGSLANWINEGPANIPGRVNSMALQPGNDQLILAGFAGGGIFKSTDGAASWHPVFDNHLNLSIGHIAFDPSNPNTVYAGTGDSNLPSYLYNGNGVFKSTDAGETWSYIGLSQAGIVMKIVVHPTNSNLIYVATMGNPHIRDNERGIYKSSDGGLTWSKKLNISNQAGASDVVINNQNPNILIASFWDRLRTNTESIIFGSNAKLYKSSDAGETWQQLTNGLPTGKMGRTGLAISKTNPSKIYAVYVDTFSRNTLVFKTVDAGVNWFQLNDLSLAGGSGDFAWYFGQVRVNPTNDDEVYLLNVGMRRKLATSSNFSSYGEVHPDVHDLVFGESGVRYAGTDGGVYINPAGSSSFMLSTGLPATQFYHINYTSLQPDTYYAGAQDNGTSRGKNTTLNDWQQFLGGDGFKCQFHPTIDGYMWAQTQNGNIYQSFDNGFNFTSSGTNLGTTDRCNWDTPFFLSKHNNPVYQLYSGTYRVYRHPWNESNWTSISPDLTDGDIYGARFHTLSTMDESPLTAQKLVVGTTDGNVWRSDANFNWTNITNGLPDRYVTSVTHSAVNASRIFVTHSGWKYNDNTPHLHRTNNNGNTWISISGNLPNLPINDLLILPNHQDSVLFCATDGGVYFTKNSGISWERVGANMPYVPAFDLDFNSVRNRLAVATFGRGVWSFPIDSIFTQNIPLLVALSGTIKTDEGEGIAAVNLANTTSTNTGTFIKNNFLGCNSYTITPKRNDNPLNGVTTFDLLLITKHLLGLDTLDTPYRIIGADANKSNSVTTFDIVLLRKLILGLDSVLSNNQSWRFVPSDFVFASAQNPFASSFPEQKVVTLQNQSLTGLNFVGIKIGDMNGNAAPTPLQNNADDREKETQIWTILDFPFEENQSIAPVFSANMNGVAALQMTINFDPNVVEFEAIVPIFAGLEPGHFGLNKIKNGIITLCFEPKNISHFEAKNGQEMFKIKFKTLKNAQISDCFHLNNTPTRAVSFSENGTEMLPILIFNKLENTLDFEAKISPTLIGQSSGTSLQYTLPKDGTIQVYLSDEMGRVQYIFNQNLVTGQYNLPLEAGLFQGSGVYFCTVKFGEKVAVLKIVKGQ
jgi:photosystem II stability/assembly factor-like uncharacterized protein